MTDETKTSNFPTTPQPISNSTARTNIDCYTGFGADYRGNISTTADGTPCSDWSQLENSYGKNAKD